MFFGLQSDRHSFFLIKKTKVMLHTLLIALILVGGIAAVTFVCIFIAKRQSKQKKERLLESHSEQLAQHNIKPDFSQIFEHRIFALDASRRIFAFVQNDEKLPSGVIELNDVAECRLWKTGLPIGSKVGRNRDAEEFINSVSMLFSLNNGEMIHVPVYTEVLDGIEEKISLSKSADQWLSRIKLTLSGKVNNLQALPES
jgi:hypothetical protein